MDANNPVLTKSTLDVPDLLAQLRRLSPEQAAWVLDFTHSRVLEDGYALGDALAVGVYNVRDMIPDGASEELERLLLEWVGSSDALSLTRRECVRIFSWARTRIEEGYDAQGALDSALRHWAQNGFVDDGM